MENPALKGTHVLLSLNPRGELMRDQENEPDIRLCNFETMQRIA